MSFCLTGDPNDINMLYLKTLSIPKSMFIHNCSVINFDSTPFPLKSLFIPYMVQSHYADPILTSYPLTHGMLSE